MPPVHISDTAFLEGAELSEAMEKKRKHLRGVIKRRLGQEPEPSSSAPPRKRRRVKSYITCMQIDNMLKVSAGKRLSDYVVKLNEHGDISSEYDLWKLPSLSLATDSGPDCARLSGRHGVLRSQHFGLQCRCAIRSTWSATLACTTLVDIFLV